MKKDPAKELYLKYSCNHLFMMKEGDEKKYLELGGGDKEKEAQWYKEFTDHWISKNNTTEISPLRYLMNANTWEATPPLLATNDCGDDYVKFWFAFTLVRMSGYSLCPAPVTYTR